MSAISSCSYGSNAPSRVQYHAIPAGTTQVIRTFPIQMYPSNGRVKAILGYSIVNPDNESFTAHLRQKGTTTPITSLSSSSSPSGNCKYIDSYTLKDVIAGYSFSAEYEIVFSCTNSWFECNFYSDVVLAYVNVNLDPISSLNAVSSSQMCNLNVPSVYVQNRGNYGFPAYGPFVGNQWLRYSVQSNYSTVYNGIYRVINNDSAVYPTFQSTQGSFCSKIFTEIPNDGSSYYVVFYSSPSSYARITFHNQTALARTASYWSLKSSLCSSNLSFLGAGDSIGNKGSVFSTTFIPTFPFKYSVQAEEGDSWTAIVYVNNVESSRLVGTNAGTSCLKSNFIPSPSSSHTLTVSCVKSDGVSPCRIRFAIEEQTKVLMSTTYSAFTGQVCNTNINSIPIMGNDSSTYTAFGPFTGNKWLQYSIEPTSGVSITTGIVKVNTDTSLVFPSSTMTIGNTCFSAFNETVSGTEYYIYAKCNSANSCNAKVIVNEQAALSRTANYSALKASLCSTSISQFGAGDNSLSKGPAFTTSTFVSSLPFRFSVRADAGDIWTAFLYANDVKIYELNSTNVGPSCMQSARFEPSSGNNRIQVTCIKSDNISPCKIQVAIEEQTVENILSDQDHTSLNSPPCSIYAMPVSILGEDQPKYTTFGHFTGNKLLRYSFQPTSNIPISFGIFEEKPDASLVSRSTQITSGTSCSSGFMEIPIGSSASTTKYHVYARCVGQSSCSAKVTVTEQNTPPKTDVLDSVKGLACSSSAPIRTVGNGTLYSTYTISQFANSVPMVYSIQAETDDVWTSRMRTITNQGTTNHIILTGSGSECKRSHMFDTPAQGNNYDLEVACSKPDGGPCNIKVIFEEQTLNALNIRDRSSISTQICGSTSNTVIPGMNVGGYPVFGPYSGNKWLRYSIQSTSAIPVVTGIIKVNDTTSVLTLPPHVNVTSESLCLSKFESINDNGLSYYIYTQCTSSSQCNIKMAIQEQSALPDRSTFGNQQTLCSTSVPLLAAGNNVTYNRHVVEPFNNTLPIRYSIQSEAGDIWKANLYSVKYGINTLQSSLNGTGTNCVRSPRLEAPTDGYRHWLEINCIKSDGISPCRVRTTFEDQSTTLLTATDYTLFNTTSSCNTNVPPIQVFGTDNSKYTTFGPFLGDRWLRYSIQSTSGAPIVIGIAETKPDNSLSFLSNFTTSSTKCLAGFNELNSSISNYYVYAKCTTQTSCDAKITIDDQKMPPKNVTYENLKTRTTCSSSIPQIGAGGSNSKGEPFFTPPFTTSRPFKYSIQAEDGDNWKTTLYTNNIETAQLSGTGSTCMESTSVEGLNMRRSEKQYKLKVECIKSDNISPCRVRIAFQEQELPTIETEPSPTNSNNIGMVAGSAVGATIIIGAIALFIWKRKAIKSVASAKISPTQTQIEPEVKKSGSSHNVTEVLRREPNLKKAEN